MSASPYQLDKIALTIIDIRLNNLRSNSIDPSSLTFEDVIVS
jgi:hypothetical protein